jgi:phenylacetate-CoA ligase
MTPTAGPAGRSGDRLLVTVLFSRTIPLIRYEMTDRVRLATGSHSCGLPFRLLRSIERRTTTCSCSPQPVAALSWFIRSCFTRSSTSSTPRDGRYASRKHELQVLIGSPDGGFNPTETERAVQNALTLAGAGRTCGPHVGRGRHSRGCGRQAPAGCGPTRSLDAGGNRP